MKICIPTATLEILTKHINVSYPDKLQVKVLKVYLKCLFFIYDKQTNRNEENQFFIDIHSNNLDQFYFYINRKKHGCAVILANLEKLQLIKIGKKYNTGKITKAYTKSFKVTWIIDNRMAEVELDLSRIFDKTYAKNDWKNLVPNHKKIINTTYNTKIDLVEFQIFMIDNIGKIDLKPSKIKGKLKSRVLTYAIAYDYFIRALKFNLNCHWFIESSTGRFYSSFTSLPSIATPFIRIKGKKVIEKDITAAQPTFLAMSVDCPEYKKDILKGEFYESIVVAMGLPLEKKNRDLVKTLLYANVFFNDSKLGKRGKLAKILDKLYPDLRNQINEMKEKDNDEDKLWFKLQSIESHMVLKRFKNHKGLLTKHDSIIFQDDYDYAPEFDKMMDEIRELINL